MPRSTTAPVILAATLLAALPFTPSIAAAAAARATVACQAQAASAATPPKFGFTFGQRLDVACTPSGASIEIASTGVDGADVTLRFRAFTAGGSADYGVPALGAGSILVSGPGTATVDWGRAMISAEVAGVAESRTSCGLDGQVIGIGAAAAAGYEPAGALTPTAWSFTPPAGASPVIAHTLESGAADAALRSLQQVLDYAETLPAGAASTYEVVQRFTVPQSGSARWVEVALADLLLPGSDLVVALYPATTSEPPLVVPAGAATAAMPAPPSGLSVSQLGVFTALAELAAPYALTAGTDYYLHVITGNAWDVHAAVTNSLAGDLFHRASPGSATWTAESALDLTFRLIGTEGASTGVLAAWLPRALSLAASPNPSSGAVTLRWSGGEGAAAIALFDLAGRPVRRASRAGHASGGSWTWDGLDSGGPPAAPGVYVARIESASGERRTTRVVLQR